PGFLLLQHLPTRSRPLDSAPVPGAGSHRSLEMARGRRPSARTLLAVLAAVLGTALLVSGVDRAALRASAFDWSIGFASALAFTFYILFSKRGLQRHDPATVLLYTFAIACVLWGIVTPPWKIAAAHYGAEV